MTTVNFKFRDWENIRRQRVKIMADMTLFQ